jgi:type I protein arginine methyltransferase
LKSAGAAALYNIHDYGGMIADELRTGAYAEALRRAITPGAVVLDIGTGTGIWALLACRLGARRVYATEPDDVIHLAREMARANGCAHRIEFIQSLSTEITLPERVDVVVAEIHGVLPLLGQSVRSIVDARRRFLAPGGRLIPRREMLWAAVVEAPELHRRHTSPWQEGCHGLDMRPALGRAANMWGPGRVKPEQLLTGARSWAVLDYMTLPGPDVRGEWRSGVSRAGTAHGLALWFDATLAEGVQLSNAPGAPELVFGRAFFPWPEPVPVALHDAVAATVQAKLVGDAYVWNWESRVLGQGDPAKVTASFKQSTFWSGYFAPARLRRRASDHVPTLNEDGVIDRLILDLVDGQTPAEQIARRLSIRFPARFPAWEDAIVYLDARIDEHGWIHRSPAWK